MKLVVGVGNPGEPYRRTRHNVGAELVMRTAERCGISLRSERFGSHAGDGEMSGVKLLLLLPQTYMNRSGEAVGSASRYHRVPPENVMVVHDDIDLALGRVKLEFNAGAAGHKGVLSVADHLKTTAFFRIRLGIGRPERKEEVESYVLSPFAGEELPAMEAMLAEGEGSLEQWIVT